MKNFSKYAQSLIEIGLIMSIVAIAGYQILSSLSQPLKQVSDRSSNSLTGSKAIGDYCADIKSGATYNPTTHECTYP